jgi:hypothetical protein
MTKFTLPLLHSTYLQRHVVLPVAGWYTPHVACSRVHAVQFATWQGSDTGSHVSNMPHTRASTWQLGAITAFLRASRPGMSWTGTHQPHRSEYAITATSKGEVQRSRGCRRPAVQPSNTTCLDTGRQLRTSIEQHCSWQTYHSRRVDHVCHVEASRAGACGWHAGRIC